MGSAESIEDLRVPPGNRLEALKGDPLVKTASGSTTSGGSAFGGRTLDQRRWRSLTAIDYLAPIHPGEVLMEDFIEGFGITQNKLAVAIHVPPRRINEIVHGKRAITADTALRLGKYFLERRLSSGSTCRRITIWTLAKVVRPSRLRPSRLSRSHEQIGAAGHRHADRSYPTAFDAEGVLGPARVSTRRQAMGAHPAFVRSQTASQ